MRWWGGILAIAVGSLCLGGDCTSNPDTASDYLGFGNTHANVAASDQRLGSAPRRRRSCPRRAKKAPPEFASETGAEGSSEAGRRPVRHTRWPEHRTPGPPSPRVTNEQSPTPGKTSTLQLWQMYSHASPPSVGGPAETTLVTLGQPPFVTPHAVAQRSGVVRTMSPNVSHSVRRRIWSLPCEHAIVRPAGALR